MLINCFTFWSSHRHQDPPLDLPLLSSGRCSFVLWMKVVCNWIDLVGIYDDLLLGMLQSNCLWRERQQMDEEWLWRGREYRPLWIDKVERDFIVLSCEIRSLGLCVCKFVCWRDWIRETERITLTPFASACLILGKDEDRERVGSRIWLNAGKRVNWLDARL